MNLEEYREQKQTGENTVVDAASQTEETTQTVEDSTQVEETTEGTTTEENTDADEQETTHGDSSTEDEVELPDNQKDAFTKRLERERKKLEDAKAKELEESLTPYKRIVDLLGGDPEKVEAAIRQNQMAAQAQELADQNGWDEEQTQWYIQQEQQKSQQQQLQKELQELRIQGQINRLRDNSDYPGIMNMEKDIISKVEQSNGALSVDEAYWALGGKNRAEQMKRETEQREVARRTQQKRVVTSDSSVGSEGVKTLSPELDAQRRRMGLSVQQVEDMMEAPSNIKEYREWKKKKAK